MWTLVSFPIKSKEELNTFLADGYEPFSVTLDPSSGERVWLKKWLEPEPEPIKEEQVEANNQQPKSKQGTGRRATPKPKAPDSN